MGYQQILFNENGKIVQQKNIFHGYQSKVKVTKDSKIFKKKIFKVGRYHSLKLYEPYNSKGLKISMRCSKTNIPMAIEDIEKKIFGFQFHPESFLTENGDFIIKKSYRHKDLKEVSFKNLWNDHGVFTTMRVIEKPPKILFFKEHIDNLIKSLKVYKINKKNLKKNS